MHIESKIKDLRESEQQQQQTAATNEQRYSGNSRIDQQITGSYIPPVSETIPPQPYNQQLQSTIPTYNSNIQHNFQM